jgi:hypothetical protein
MAVCVPLRKKLRERQIHRAGDLGERVKRRNGMPILYAGQVAAQQARALFDVALRHASLQPVIPDSLANIHRAQQTRARKKPKQKPKTKPEKKMRA